MTFVRSRKNRSGELVARQRIKDEIIESQLRREYQDGLFHEDRESQQEESDVINGTTGDGIAERGKDTELHHEPWGKKQYRLRYEVDKSPVYDFTTAMMNRLRELIVLRYELDGKILREGSTARLDQRPLVEDDMKRADNALTVICSILDIWDQRAYFETEEEYQKFKRMKTRITNTITRKWTSNPPWTERGLVDDGLPTNQDRRPLQHLHPESLDERRSRDDAGHQLGHLTLRDVSSAPSGSLNEPGSLENSVKSSRGALTPVIEVSDSPSELLSDGSELALDAVSAQSEAVSDPVSEDRQAYTKRAPTASYQDLTPATEDEIPEDYENFSDAEDITFPKESDCKLPMLVTTAIDSIVRDFGMNQTLQDLLHVASIEMPHEKLFGVLCESLKRYYDDIRFHSDTPVEPHAKEVLAVDEHRRCIARDLQGYNILSGISSDDEDDETAQHKAVTKSAIATKLNKFSHISVDGLPFRNLLNTIRESLLPSDLLVELSSVPREKIFYETSQKPTILETLQRRFEGFTDLEWDWWPLPPSKKPLSEKESRVLWQCVSIPRHSLLSYRTDMRPVLRHETLAKLARWAARTFARSPCSSSCRASSFAFMCTGSGH